MPRSNNNLLYIPFNPLNPPRHRPSLPYRLGGDISGMGMGTCYIGIVERSPGILHITIRQDSMSNHYTQQVPQGEIIDPEKQDIHLRCLRVGRAVKLLWQATHLPVTTLSATLTSWNYSHQLKSPSASWSPHPQVVLNS